MNKGGISHIEIILAFVIFIGAVGFGLYFFNTGDSSRLIDSVLEYSFREIERNTTLDVEVFSVKVNNSVSGEVLAIDFPGVGGNAGAETYDGEILNAMRAGDLVYVQNDHWANTDFIYVKFCEDLDEDSVSPVALNEELYQIGSSETRKVISEKRFKTLNESYYADYLGLKKQGNFNLPDRADFGFSLVFGEGDKIITTKERLSNVEVFSDSKRVEVLRENRKIVFADLVVEVW
jgi:hypothetical protein